ncbi:hypothetical protein GGU11DRAFT_759934 [Lentinula aff. detonsa]|nr:hypothetical protein GGU11DRAFT_759934 [Lentinula aff. detonsa]
MIPEISLQDDLDHVWPSIPQSLENRVDIISRILEDESVYDLANHHQFKLRDRQNDDQRSFDMKINGSSSDKIRVLKDGWPESDFLEEHKIRETVLADAQTLYKREEHSYDMQLEKHLAGILTAYNKPIILILAEGG